MGELARPLGKGAGPLPEPAFSLQACPGAMMLDDCVSEGNIHAPACSSLVTLFSLLPHPWHMFSNSVMKMNQRNRAQHLFSPWKALLGTCLQWMAFPEWFYFGNFKCTYPWPSKGCPACLSRGLNLIVSICLMCEFIYAICVVELLNSYREGPSDSFYAESK